MASNLLTTSFSLSNCSYKSSSSPASSTTSCFCFILRYEFMRRLLCWGNQLMSSFSSYEKMYDSVPSWSDWSFCFR